MMGDSEYTYESLKDKSEYTLEQYLRLCTVIAEKGENFVAKIKGDNDRRKLIEPNIVQPFIKPCLIYEHIAECLCSLFEAIDDNDQDLIREQIQQMSSSLSQYWQYGKVEQNNDIKEYQNIIDYEIDNNCIDKKKENILKLNMRELLGRPLVAKIKVSSVEAKQKVRAKPRLAETQERIEGKVKPLLRKLVNKNLKVSPILQSNEKVSQDSALKFMLIKIATAKEENKNIRLS